jgi:hypothetical protein
VIKVYYPEKNAYLDVSLTDITNEGMTRDEKLSRTDFTFLSIVGEGGYGKVWKV